MMFWIFSLRTHRSGRRQDCRAAALISLSLSTSPSNHNSTGVPHCRIEFVTLFVRARSGFCNAQVSSLNKQQMHMMWCHARTWKQTTTRLPFAGNESLYVSSQSWLGLCDQHRNKKHKQNNFLICFQEGDHWKSKSNKTPLTSITNGDNDMTSIKPPPCIICTHTWYFHQNKFQSV